MAAVAGRSTLHSRYAARCAPSPTRRISNSYDHSLESRCLNWLFWYYWANPSCIWSRWRSCVSQSNCKRMVIESWNLIGWCKTSIHFKCSKDWPENVKWLDQLLAPSGRPAIRLIATELLHRLTIVFVSECFESNQQKSYCGVFQFAATFQLSMTILSHVDD